MSSIHQGISLQLSAFLIFISLFTPRSMAQVKSDGTTNTIVNANGNNFTILNGIEKGNNLFHSFSNFSIPTAGSASFDLSNTPNITTIFSRVTGGSISNIDGLIQTLNGKSPVSLYLMNPAGIVFGKNASLNIGGSFVGTTANSIKFSDGVEFNATAVTPPLLTMSVPIGLQMGPNPAPIQVQGNLSTTQDLTLQAGNLDLQGQLVAGRDLTLNARDTVQIRNTTGPFLAQAGRNLTIQGNQNIDILALNQPNPALQSEGNLSLISDGNISGDAHFLSGGNVSFETLVGFPGKFVSKYDPVIYANGDVVFGTYVGAALKVEATGSIDSQGNIVIIAPDTTIPIGDPDFNTLTTQPALILRAGVPSIATPNLPQLGVGYFPTNFTTGTLTGLPPGSINVGTIYTGSGVGNGGSITLAAQGDIIVTGGLYSEPSGNSGNGGAIALSSAKGNISLNGGAISSSILGNAGAITLTAQGDINVAGGLESTSSGGNGGAIALSSTNGNISLNGLGYSNSYGTSGNGGDITVSTTNGNISLNGTLFSAAYSYGTSGNGGDITVSTTNGNISLNGDLLAYSYGTSSSGNGGAIKVSATNGSISNQATLYSLSLSQGEGNSGQGGAIILSATNGISNQGDLDSFSLSQAGGNSGQGGAIMLSTTNGSISNQGNLNSFSLSQAGGNSGQGGNISLSAQNGNIFGNGSNLYTFSIAPQGTANNGGTVTLNAQNHISGLTVLTASSSAQSGAVSIIGQGNLAIADTLLQTSKQVSIYTDFTGILTVPIHGTGRSGDINIGSAGDITLTNSQIQSDAKGSDPAGNISITSPGLVTLNQSQIISSTSSAGNAGNITINADGLTLLNGTSINSSTNASGNAGEINVTANDITLNQSSITSQSSSQGDNGSIKINTNTLDLIDNALLSTAASQSGKAGNLSITANNMVNLQDGSQISSNSTGSGDGGTVEIASGSLFLNQNSQINASTTSSIGGNLVLNVSQLLQMSDRSILNAGAVGTGNGGNITLNTPFLLGSGNSDIIATAVLGHGGNINITTDGIYGLAFRNQLTPENDIVASSQFGVNGTVEIVAPNSALVKLPENVVDHSQQIIAGCANQNSSSFVASGRGGIPPNPTYELISDGSGGIGQRTWSDVRDISAYRKSSNIAHIIPESPEVLVQAIGWYRNAQGKVELIAAEHPVPVRNNLTCAAVPKN